MIKRKAFTIVEFLVASALILTVLIFSALALDSNARVITVDRARDAATTIGYQVLDKARLYGCGNITGNPEADGGVNAPGSRDESEIVERCESIFDAEVSPELAEQYQELSASSTFVGVIYDTLDSERPYLVTLDFEYDTEDGRMCSVAEGGDYNTPSVVRYVLTVHWMVRSEIKSSSLITTEPLPTDFRFAQNGILVSFPSAAGAAEEVKVVDFAIKSRGSSAPLKTVLTRTTTSDCVWFSNFGDLAQFDAVTVAVQGGSSLGVLSELQANPQANIKVNMVSPGGS